MSGKIPARAWGMVLGFLVFFPCAAFSAGRYDERLFKTALSLLRNKKPVQALETFEELSRDFPDSPLADDALYRSGAYYYPARGLENLHDADRSSLSRAGQFFHRIQEQYSRSDMAPRALYKLALIALETRSPERSLDEAFARFSRVLTLYPESPMVDRALLGAAFTQIRMRSYYKAMEYLEELLNRHPDSPTVPRAMLLLATCRAFKRQVVGAMETLQALVDRDPEGPIRARALNLLTLLYRTRFLPELGRGVPFHRDFEFEATTAGAGIRSCADLAVDGEGRVYLADPRQGLLWSFRPDGSLLGRLHRPEGIRWIAVREGHGVLTGSKDSVYLGKRRKAVMRGEEAVRDIDSVVISEEGEIFLLDRKEREVLLLKGSLDFHSRLYRASSEKPLGIRLSPVGDLLMLTSPPALYLRDQAGDWRRILAGEERLGSRPDDFDVDRLGNLYFLSGREGKVILSLPTGEVLTQLQLEPGPDGTRFLPSVLAVDGAGSLYLCSRKGDRIVRYR